MEYKNSPDGFDFLFLLLEAALGLVAELAQFGSQSHGALLLSLAALVKTNRNGSLYTLNNFVSTLALIQMG